MKNKANHIQAGCIANLVYREWDMKLQNSNYALILESYKMKKSCGEKKLINRM